MVKYQLITAAATSLLLIPAVIAIYTKNSPVLQVDARSYEDLIAKSNYTSIVEFYAPWCGHCKNLKPAYEKAAKSLSGLAKVAAVDCEEDHNKQFCGSMGVKGFPTLKIVRPGKKPGRPMVEEYQGGRTAKAIVDAVIDKIPNHVKRLKEADYAEWAKEPGPKVILFTDKGTVSALLKSVAIDFLGALDVAQIRNKETEAVEAFEVERFPSLILLPGGGKEPITYGGELKKEPIVKFLSQVASPNSDPAPKTRKESIAKQGKDKDSKSAKKFSQSSASQASKHARTDAASQTLESIIDDPTDSPNPQVQTEKPVKLREADLAKPITSLLEGLSLQQKCLNDKASTCVLALLPEEQILSGKTIEVIRELSELHKKHEVGNRNLFPFYQVPSTNSQGATLRQKLALSSEDIEIIAINGKRGWWVPYSDGFSFQNFENWVDSIRMSDVKKSDVPDALIANAADLPAEPVKLNIPSDSEGMVDALKDQLPEGVEFRMEEISDEEYERLMSRGGAQQGNEHDEL